jgi:F0F1-type ATP synthase membrane subunit c/vacuolar-type H+-ATPase subunit K
MSPKANLIVAILLGAGILFFALRYGTIGGAGAGATREKNPFLFWLGVLITAVFEAVAIVIFISTIF